MKAMFAILCCLSLSAFAAPVDKTLAKAEPLIHGVIKNKLSKLGMNAKSISDSPVEGMFQVMTDRGLFYFSQNGQFIFQGKIYDLDNGAADISEDALAQVRIDGVKAFEGTMIVYPAKDEKHKVTVFTDTTCGYCRKLHSQIDDYNKLGITVQYLAFPRSGVTGPTFRELQAIWCADDNKEALTKVKNGGNVDLAAAKECKAPIAEQYAMGVQVGVSGTPAIILDDGRMIPGYQPPAQLFAALEAK